MPLFAHQPYYTVPNNDFNNFGSLVRFIDDWDKHFSQQKNARRGGQQQAQSNQPRRINLRNFTPRFDVRETEQGYELHGELPGVEKKDINIEFSDLQTIVISGSVERNYTAGTPPAGLLGDSNNDLTMSGAVTTTDAVEPNVHDDASETHSNKSFHATVEDSNEDGESEWVKPNTTTGEHQVAADDNTSVAPTINTPATTVAAPATTGAATEAQQQPRHKYWVQERSVGRFSRSFTFADRVDHDGVTASLENGILTVVVPRAKKPETRRIAIA